MFKSSPAFSIQGKCKMNYLSLDASSRPVLQPSPTTYQIEKCSVTNFRKNPTWKQNMSHLQNWRNCLKMQECDKFQSRPRIVRNGKSYLKRKSTQQAQTKQRKFGIIGKQNGRATHKVQNSPSPVSYNPNKLQKCITVSGSSNFAQRQSPPHSNTNETPGPGAYQYQQRDIAMKSSQSASNFVIGKNRRFRQDPEPKYKPGPGAYQYKRPASAGPGRFGQAKRDSCNRSTAQNPGRNFKFISYLAGQYMQNRTISNECSNSLKGFTLKGKVIMKDLETRPGPANYNPNLAASAMMRSSPSFSMSSKYKSVQTQHTPAPNNVILDKLFQYEPIKPSTQNTNGSISFGKAKRKPLVNFSIQVPGPGQYKQGGSNQTLAKFKSSPKFSLGKSRIIDMNEDFPGPGTYQPNKNVVKQRPQSANIGKGTRDGFYQKRPQSPGPGQYEVGTTTAMIANGQGIGRMYQLPRKTAPSHIFGKDSRMKNNINQNQPGPGQYQLMSSVGNLPSYARR